MLTILIILLYTVENKREEYGHGLAERKDEENVAFLSILHIHG
jgi:hypothetical protein